MWNGLPPMDAPGATMLGEIDVTRNGAHTGGIAADLRTPEGPVAKASAPTSALASNPAIVALVLALAFVVVNARTRG